MDIKIAKVSVREKVLAEAELGNVLETREIEQETFVCKNQLPNVEYVHDVNVVINNPPQP